MTDVITPADLTRSDAAPTATATTAVIPAPRVVRTALGTWRVADGSRIAGPAAVQAVLRRFADDVATDSGIVLEPVHDDAAGTVDVLVELDATGLEGLPYATGVRADGLTLDDADERYGLEVSQGGARVWGATPEAVHRGLTTLRQLVTVAVDGGVAQVPCATIHDGPRFAWRGLSVDVGRTFHDVEAIQRVIDMCSLYKLNVLHLHLTDDPGWRVEVPSWPALTEVGGAGALGARPGGHYTQADVAAMVAYAAERFITVVPEVDLPGHTTAVFAAYPELAPEPTEVAAQAKQLGLAIGTLELDRGRTREFVRDVYAAVAAQFPTSAWIHIGGDEAFGMPDGAHAAFVDFSIATVRELGRKAIGWQEAARAAVGPDEIVQYWIEPKQLGSMFESGSEQQQLPLPPEVMELVADNLRKSFEDVPAALAKGARILVSPNSTLYLDRPHVEPTASDEQEARRARVGLPFYPPASLRDLVEWDPVAETPGIDDDDRIAGVEAAVWCETVTDRDDLEFLLLPRLAGVGERAWSAAPTEWDEYVLRLAEASRAWDRRGWTWFRPASVDWRGDR
jgi:hexosaminidase